MSHRFVPGLLLSERLWSEHVAPLLAATFPTVRHAAALLGAGSEVLGFDTARSTDHDWGPRLQLFLDREDCAELSQDISALLSERLPKEILGYPTHLVRTGNTSTRHMETTDGPISHGVQITDLRTWFHAILGFDPCHDVATLDWLAVPTQALATVTAGAVFHDDSGDLTRARTRLAWYPDDVWRYVLACQWQRIAEEEPFVGRCAEVGDEVGSAMVAARLVRDMMRLRLLQQRRYPPYSKWLGSAVARLPDAPDLIPRLTRVMSAPSAPERQAALASVYEYAARMQNDLWLAPHVDPATRPFHDRPFQVLHAERFAEALGSAISDTAIRALPLVGSIDQWVDNTTAIARQQNLRRAQLELIGTKTFDSTP